MKELEAENARLRRAVFDLTLNKIILARRRACIDYVRSELKVSERRVCRMLGQHRSTQRRVPMGRDDEEQLTADIVGLARQYRKIAEPLRPSAGLVVNDKRVERFWRREGLKVPAKQPKHGRLGFRTDPVSVFARSAEPCLVL
jgi:putative transposase